MYLNFDVKCSGKYSFSYGTSHILFHIYLSFAGPSAKLVEKYLIKTYCLIPATKVAGIEQSLVITLVIRSQRVKDKARKSL